jgi:protein SCO1/2
MNDRFTRILIIASAFGGGLIVCLLVIFFVTGGMTGITQSRAAIGGAFTLVDQDGRVVRETDLKGRPSLLFFGFTHCPDVCPTALFDISEVLRALGPQADNVNALFVTVDPERDTPDKLKDYLASFDPHLKGLTGDVAAVTAMLKAYRVYANKVPLDGGNYTMDHTALVYLMDKDGRFVAPFNLKRRPEEAASDLRRYL